MRFYHLWLFGIVSCLVAIQVAYAAPLEADWFPESGKKNLPTVISKSKPQAEDFNAIFNRFLETEHVDISREEASQKLLEHFSKETSNALYAKLKLKEKKFEGAIYIQPFQIHHKQVIVVSARIRYRGFLRVTMHCEYLFLVFTPQGRFLGVERGDAKDYETG